jgi:hypothetical protein
MKNRTSARRGRVTSAGGNKIARLSSSLPAAMASKPLAMASSSSSCAQNGALDP